MPRRVLKRALLLIPPVRRYVEGVRAVRAERDALRASFAGLPVAPGPFLPPRRVPHLPAEQRQVVDAFHDLYYQEWREDHPRLNIGWLGFQTQKTPNDLWIYQEIIAEQRPDVIVETGTRYGGSALFFANLCDLLGHGRVVSVDLRQQDGRPQHPRITYIQGSSTDASVLELVAHHVPEGARVFVVLDSDHSREHVHAELRTYHRFVRPGGYIVVEDTNVNGHPTFAAHGPGPMEGLDDFLAETDAFEIDPARERFLMTCNPRGFLKRIR